MHFRLVGSQFGIGGVAVVLLGAWMLGMFGGGGGQRAVAPAEQTEAGASSAAKACSADAASRFSCQVLASTEDTWAQIFRRGQRYAPTKLVFYSGHGQSGCGAAQSAMGPFYCPTDKSIYLDTDFFRELSQRFGAPAILPRPM